MPELPEVETVKETLKQHLIGLKIVDVFVYYDKIIHTPSLKLFQEQLQNQTFTNVRRYGKYLLFDLEDYTLVSHLRMEGKYYLRKHLKEITKHEHIVFALDNSEYLSYHDVRKFGTMELVPYHGEQELLSLSVLGKEINSPDLDADTLYPLIKKANRPIKSILLDQHIVTGLGNIYVDETLFLSKIHPKTLGKNLSYFQIERIVKSAKITISKAIELGGTTIRTYQATLGVDGRFQNQLNVHTLVGKACNHCNDTIVKTKVGGRGTYFCPTCQREDYPLIIGLTGGIASGKSMISKWFKEQKVKVLDADKIYKDLLKNNKIMYNEIVKEFGFSVTNNNEIDRAKLGNIIFNNPSKRQLLNDITHPFVMKKMGQEIQKFRHTHKVLVLDIPLLFEAKLEYMVDIIMLVYVDVSTQIKRLMERDQISLEFAKTKIASQINLDFKKTRSDVIIDNSGDYQRTKEQFLAVFNILRSDGYVI